ncbi:Ferritin heavy polypeptide-like 17 [Halocaridina rubra]|uniref:Ferritin n=1 Tax=Halocaridina rubra TaxID=373956 RepID=A0AAN8ZY46_HALRR
MERFILLILVFVGSFLAAVNCTPPSETWTCETTTNYPQAVCEVPSCTFAIKSHIRNEYDAAFTYMYMASYFAQDTIDRPGLAKFLFEAASEERGHAIQMLDYLNLRGIKLDGLDYNFNSSWIPADLTYQTALEKAINMEITVTDLIYNVVTSCGIDYHAADVFTNPILDEQHDGVRKLQGAYRTYLDMKTGQGASGMAFAEYVFDRKLLSGEI